ncbi:kinase-like domain-containing protein [Glomus cerebriforme]|uniref:Kinase-like domain-containing protein n=1 Tax=Glomus cerebriforme TaxID=658196 RepID=A0A397TKF0_9GLOM|nr:kinase-like domain-containing protein [Glomus cerebriforme]
MISVVIQLLIRSYCTCVISNLRYLLSIFAYLAYKMAKRTASDILESPIDKDIKISNDNVWGHLISSRGAKSLNRKCYIIGKMIDSEDYYIYLEGSNENFAAGIYYDEVEGRQLECLSNKSGVQRFDKGRGWVEMRYKECLKLEEGQLLSFESRGDYALFEFRMENVSRCGCKMIQSYNYENNKIIENASVERKDEVQKQQNLSCFFHKYKFVKRLGGGGNGNVHLVKNIYNDKFYAAKISQNSLKEEFKIMKELKNLKCIVDVYEGYYDALLKNNYIIMSWIKCNSLKSWINNNKDDITNIKLKELSILLISVIQQLHENGWLHRDIKPENFLVGDDPFSIYLTDFAFARKISSKPSDLTGTLQYMSLEAIEGQSQGPGSDWWSLGLVLYFCITKGGIFFVPRRNTFQCMKDEINSRITNIQNNKDSKIKLIMRNGLEFVELLKICLAKDPEARNYENIKKCKIFTDAK